jgi:Flp pilus assembly protein protease CpaA
VLREVAVLALGLALTAAAWQDVKTREIDVRIFAAAGVAAAVLITGITSQGFLDRDNYPCKDIPVKKSL